MIYKNILDLIGNTPIISFEDIFIKLEQFNPAGSIKDRVALKMIEELEKRNKLNKNSTDHCNSYSCITASYFNDCAIFV